MSNVLEQKVLLLNKAYAPVAVISARRALVKLYIGVAEVIAVEDGMYYNYDFEEWVEVSELRQQVSIFTDGENIVRTSRLIILVPRILRLLSYSRVPSIPVKLTRKNIYIRDMNTCQYCGKQFPSERLNIDHVVPRSMGGKNTWTNLVCTCQECNTKKGNRTPHEAGMRLLRKPEKPYFNTLFDNTVPTKKYEDWKHFLFNTKANVVAVREN